MKLITKAVAVAALLAGSMLPAGAQAAVVTVPWSSPTIVDTGGGNAYNFNEAYVSFTGFYTDGLLSITDASSPNGNFHSHAGATITGLMDVHLNGGWVNIFSGTTTSSAGFDLTTVGMIPFAAGIVDGVRFDASPNQNQNFHSFEGMQFNFNSPSIPEPSVIVLLGLGGLGLWRRRAIRQS